SSAAMPSAALAGVRVVELAGLAPAPFCGLLLRDLGARVVRVDRADAAFTVDRLARGKESLALDLKSPSGGAAFRRLCAASDVLIEPFRPGVMEKLGFGPDRLLAENPRLVYSRLSGYGQSGPLAQRPGHDINYLAASGVLSRLADGDSPPRPPVNLLADFAGGGLLAALGIVAALFERQATGLGRILDANLTEGAAYLASWLFASRDLFVWRDGARPGENILDGGAHFYRCYRCLDGRHLAVGALEPQFYAAFVAGLGLTEAELPQATEDAAGAIATVTKIIGTKTRDDWLSRFGPDACVNAVEELSEAQANPHAAVRASFSPSADTPGHHLPRPPRFASVAPDGSGVGPDEPFQPSRSPRIGEHTCGLLAELGYSEAEIRQLLAEGRAVQCSTDGSPSGRL
ncbi:hypothetical protein BOX15_Mlig020004g2, partial [Macrostomum lignano]